MNENSIKCYSFEHKELKAICYCWNCNIYMCNKCENSHSKLYQNHWTNSFDNSSEFSNWLSLISSKNFSKFDKNYSKKGKNHRLLTILQKF